MIDMFATAGNAKLPIFCTRGVSPKCMGCRCFGDIVGQPRSLCVSPDLPCSSGVTEDQVLPESSPSDCSLVASTSVVSAPASLSGRVSDCVSGPSGPVVSGRGQDFTPSGPRPSSFCLESVRSSLRAQGVSESVTALAAEARRPFIIRTFDSRLFRFREWCSECEVSATSASLERVSSFIKLLFDEGKSISSVRYYRSAIGAVLSGFPDGSSLGDNEVLAQLIRGMSVVRPMVRCLVSSWSI